MKRKRYLIITFVLLIAAGIIAYRLINYYSELDEQRKIVDVIRNEVVYVDTLDTPLLQNNVLVFENKKDDVSDVDKESNNIDPNLLRRIDFKKLQGINPDCKRWLYIPDTNIDAYVMQERNSDEYYYGWRNIYGQGSGTGSFFTPHVPFDADDAHLIILGHRMNNGDMFGNLPWYYANVNNASKYPYVYIYYPDKAERWSVWAAVDAMRDDELFSVPFTIGSGDYDDLLYHVCDISRYMFYDKPHKYTPIVCLSTCNQWTDGSWQRFVTVCIPDCEYNYKTKTVKNASDIYVDKEAESIE